MCLGSPALIRQCWPVSVCLKAERHEGSGAIRRFPGNRAKKSRPVGGENRASQEFQPFPRDRRINLDE